MKVLVTGGTGFIGSHLVERLCRQGDEVISVAKDGGNVALLQQLGAKVVLGDLNNGVQWDDILEGVEIVYHLAGSTRARRTCDYYEGNTLATKRLVAICSEIARNLKRFLYVSSLTAVGPSSDGTPLREDAPYHPVSEYGKSKMLAELEVLCASARLPVTIVRPSAVYGPRDREWCPYIRMTLRGIQPRVGFGTKLLNLIHCDDLTEGILLAARTPGAVNQIYFIGSEQTYTIAEFGQAIAAALNRHPLRIPLPHLLAYAVGAIGGAIGKCLRYDVMFNVQKVRESVQHAWMCSVEKAKSELGFRQQISLMEGMRATCDWYRSHHWI